MLNLFFLAASLLLVIKSADVAIKYATSLAQVLRLPKYIIGFLLVAVISILPETFISIDASLRGVSSFGLGTLFGSNVADLTLVFAIIIFSTVNGVRVGSRNLENNKWYPFILALPILVGFDGYYSRAEGAFLVGAGILFYYWIFSRNHHLPAPPVNRHLPNYRGIFFLLASMVGLLLGSHLTVKYGMALAGSLGVSHVLIAMFVVGLGTTLPELFFSLRAVRQRKDELALGDILGTVIADATIVVGILALINPFFFPVKIIYVTAVFMVLASLLLFAFMRSGKILTKKEGLLLLLFYAIFVAAEYLVNG